MNVSQDIEHGQRHCRGKIFPAATVVVPDPPRAYAWASVAMFPRVAFVGRAAGAVGTYARPVGWNGCDAGWNLAKRSVGGQPAW